MADCHSKTQLHLARISRYALENLSARVRAEVLAEK